MWILFLLPPILLLVYLLTRGSGGGASDHGIEEGFVSDTDSSYDGGGYDYC